MTVITVVGAGLGGLTLASVLHANGLEAIVHELDAGPDARHQGGMLDMHEESGQAALRAAGLSAQFQAIIHAGGEATRVIDKDGTVRHESTDDGGRPEVNRHDLRRILLDSLPPDTVRWDTKVIGVRSLGDGHHELTFADGTTLTTELLIGADGAWSKVRPLVSAAVPEYTGVSFVETTLFDAATHHPATAELVGPGMMFALAEEKALMTHVENDGAIHCYAARKAPTSWLPGIDFADTDAAKAAVVPYFADWDPRLRALVADARGPLVPRPIHALPVGHSWDRTPGVTLLGDAAHLMSPFAGEGANLAMRDGAELAHAIAANPDDPETALLAYERALHPRGAAAAQESADNLTLCFGPDASARLLTILTADRTTPH